MGANENGEGSPFGEVGILCSARGDKTSASLVADKTE
jgi:hypothetical protein